MINKEKVEKVENIEQKDLENISYQELDLQLFEAVSSIEVALKIFAELGMTNQFQYFAKGSAQIIDFALKMKEKQESNVKEPTKEEVHDILKEIENINLFSEE